MKKYFLLLLLCVSGSCDLNIKGNEFNNIGVKIDPTLTAPILSKNYSAKDLLTNLGSLSNYLVEDKANNYYRINFSRKLTKVKVSDFINIPTSLPSIDYPVIPATPVGLSSPQNINYVDKIIFKIGNIMTQADKIKTMVVKTGSIDFSLKGSSVPTTGVSIKLTLSSIKSKSGNVPEVTITETSKTSANLTTQSIDLAGATITVTNGQIPILYTGTINQGTASTTGLNLGVEMKNITFTSMTANFTEQALTLADNVVKGNVNVDLLSSLPSGTFSLADAKINFSAKNSMGVSAKVTFPPGSLSLVNSKTGEKEDLKIIYGSNTDYGSVPFARSTVVGTPIITPSTALIPSTAFTKKFNQINYNAGFTIASKDLETTQDNFLNTSDSLEITATLDAPMKVSLVGMTYTQDVDLTIPSTDIIDQYINSNGAALTVKVANLLAFDCKIQVSFLDQNGNVINNAFDNQDNKVLMTASKVDSRGVSKNISYTTVTANFEKTKISNILKGMKKARIKIWIDTNNSNTTNTDPVYILLNDYVSITASITAGVTIERNLTGK